MAAVDLSVRERASGEVMIVRTKCDLAPRDAEFAADVQVSAQSGVGLAELLAQVQARITGMRGAPALDAPALTSARHRAAVATAHAELEAFQRAWRDDVLPASVAAIHVRAAADALGGLIGVVEVDDVLDVVFAKFCVGK
jgi:Predicted GTPase